MTSFLMMLVACNGGSRLVQDLAVEPGAVPGTAWVTWTSAEEVTGTVRYGKDGTLGESVPVAAGTEHRVLLLSPQVGETYTVQVEVETAGGKTATSEEVEADIDPPVQGTPRFTQIAYDPGKACMDGGYVMLSWLGQNDSGVGIVDREGKWVWAFMNDVPDTRVARARLGRDGQSLLWTYNDAALREDVSEVVKMSIDGETVTSTRIEAGHHDFVELPDGRLAWLGYEFRELDIVDDDPDAGLVNVGVDTIVVDGEVVFSFFDDVTTEVYDISDDPGTETDFLGPDLYDYSHANSLVYHEEHEAFFIMYRWLDAMHKVDAQTGEILWQFNDIPGVPGTLTGNDADRFNHAHFSEAWDDQLLIFDNHDIAPPSMLKQYTVDDANQTFELNWSYESDRLENILGDVRRIPIEGCDNLLVSFSNQARLVEMTRDGEIVWEVAGDQGAVTSRVQFIPDLHDFSDAAYPL